MESYSSEDAEEEGYTPTPRRRPKGIVMLTPGQRSTDASTVEMTTPQKFLFLPSDTTEPTEELSPTMLRYEDQVRKLDFLQSPKRGSDKWETIRQALPESIIVYPLYRVVYLEYIRSFVNELSAEELAQKVANEASIINLANVWARLDTEGMTLDDYAMFWQQNNRRALKRTDALRRITKAIDKWIDMVQRWLEGGYIVQLLAPRYVSGEVFLYWGQPANVKDDILERRKQWLVMDTPIPTDKKARHLRHNVIGSQRNFFAAAVAPYQFHEYELGAKGRLIFAVKPKATRNVLFSLLFDERKFTMLEKVRKH